MHFIFAMQLPQAHTPNACYNLLYPSQTFEVGLFYSGRWVFELSRVTCAGVGNSRV